MKLKNIRPINSSMNKMKIPVHKKYRYHLLNRVLIGVACGSVMRQICIPPARNAAGIWSPHQQIPGVLERLQSEQGTRKMINQGYSYDFNLKLTKNSDEAPNSEPKHKKFRSTLAVLESLFLPPLASIGRRRCRRCPPRSLRRCSRHPDAEKPTDTLNWDWFGVHRRLQWRFARQCGHRSPSRHLPIIVIGWSDSGARALGQWERALGLPQFFKQCEYLASAHRWFSTLRHFFRLSFHS